MQFKSLISSGYYLLTSKSLKFRGNSSLYTKIFKTYMQNFFEITENYLKTLYNYNNKHLKHQKLLKLISKNFRTCEKSPINEI